MKLSITEGADPNYLATIVKTPKINNHPNADKLEIVEVFGNTIVVGKGSYAEGELVVYFPVESAISRKFLSWANLLDNAELNADGKTKGFFGKQNRVKAIALRSIPSQGFLFKVFELAKYYKIDENAFKIGDTFDTVGDDVLVTKYIKGTERQSNDTTSKKSRVPTWVNNTLGYLPRPIRRSAYVFVNAWFNRNQEGIKSQIVEGQFKLHYKTEQLGKNIWIVDPDDHITITNKVHGCVKYDTPIQTLEYGILPIKVIVDNKIPVHVKGYDINENISKWVKVDDYFYKKDDGEWYEIELDDGTKLIITGNNPVWMPELSCYRKVGDLVVGDELLVENIE